MVKNNLKYKIYKHHNLSCYDIDHPNNKFQDSKSLEQLIEN